MTETKTVLVVDDEEEIRRGTQLWLSRAGYETYPADGGVEAIAAARRLQPDAVVLDVRMPGMDGLAALAELRRGHETRNIPVVMLSASLGDQHAALEAGARYFLTKPYESKALVAAVRSAIDPHANHNPVRHLPTCSTRNPL